MNIKKTQNKLIKRNFQIKTYVIFIVVPIFYIMNSLSNWKLLEISGIKGVSRYEDLTSILTSGHCYSIIRDGVFRPDSAHKNCIFSYGKPLVQFLSVLRIPLEAASFIGIIVASIVLTVLLFQKNVLLENPPLVMKLSLLLSPGLWLLFERGNFDEIMFLAIFLAAFTLERGKSYASVFILFITSIFKFYTLPLLFLFLFINRSRNYRIFTSIFFILATISVLENFQIVSRIPETWFISFGLPYPGLFINLVFKHLASNHYLLSNNLAFVIGLILFLSILGFEFLIRNTTFFRSFLKGIGTIQKDFYIWIFGVVHLSCFFAGMNYDYRMIFEIALFLKIGGMRLSGRPLFVCNSLVFLTSILNCFAFGRPLSSSVGVVLQFIGATSQYLVTSIIFWVTLNQTRKIFSRDK